jgi:hypothetical protein
MSSENDRHDEQLNDAATGAAHHSHEEDLQATRQIARESDNEPEPDGEAEQPEKQGLPETSSLRHLAARTPNSCWSWPPSPIREMAPMRWSQEPARFRRCTNGTARVLRFLPLTYGGYRCMLDLGCLQRSATDRPCRFQPPRN